jgi:lipopolysaccharide biosynthesis regulator YciM
MGRVKEKNKRKTLNTFLNGFKKNSQILEIEEMPFEEALIKPLTLLAQAFNKQGEYQKSINLNLYLIDNISNFFEKERILEQLGKTYLKAGFLKRSESIYLEILHKHPRNITALYDLGVVYELLLEYEKALETLGPLKILGEKTNSIEAHIKLTQLLNSKTLHKQDKVASLCKLLQNEHYPYYRIMKALFSLDLEAAWANIQADKNHSILDILWFLPSLNLNLDIISKDKTLSAIFFAKGEIDENKYISKSNIFTVDTIVSAKKGGDDNVDLLFNYGCGKCKQHFPIGFTRCPKCYAIGTIQIKETLAKKQSQTSYSLL